MGENHKKRETRYKMKRNILKSSKTSKKTYMKILVMETNKKMKVTHTMKSKNLWKNTRRRNIKPRSL
jgi:hypothetical protein